MHPFAGWLCQKAVATLVDDHVFTAGLHRPAEVIIKDEAFLHKSFGDTFFKPVLIAELSDGACFGQVEQTQAYKVRLLPDKQLLMC